MSETIISLSLPACNTRAALSRYSFVMGKFESGEVFAVPLVSVKNDSDVAALITERLLKLFREKNNIQ